MRESFLSRIFHMEGVMNYFNKVISVEKALALVNSKDMIVTGLVQVKRMIF
jgi:hypothetical protein